MGDFNDDLQALGKDTLRRSLIEAMKAQGLGIEDGTTANLPGDA